MNRSELIYFVQRYSLASVLTPGNRVRFTDVQLRSCDTLQVYSDFPPEVNPEVSCVLLNYSTASYVTAEVAPQDLSPKRFQTPWKEVRVNFLFRYSLDISHSIHNIGKKHCC